MITTNQTQITTLQVLLPFPRMPPEEPQPVPLNVQSDTDRPSRWHLQELACCMTAYLQPPWHASKLMSISRNDATCISTADATPFPAREDLSYASGKDALPRLLLESADQVSNSHLNEFSMFGFCNSPALSLPCVTSPVVVGCKTRKYTAAIGNLALLCLLLIHLLGTSFHLYEMSYMSWCPRLVVSNNLLIS